MEDYSRIYINKTVSLHGIPLSIIFDRGSHFTSHFWRTFKKGLVTVRPQMDGQPKCTIHTMEYMLIYCVIDLKGNWDDHLRLVDFSYNNSYRSSTFMAPFEALYGRQCRYPVTSFVVFDSFLFGPEIIYEALEK